MTAFDQMCLTQVEDLAPEESRKIRRRENVNRAVFARYLNVTAGLLSQWERGEQRARGASARLLTLVAKNGLGAVARRLSPDGCRPRVALRCDGGDKLVDCT